MLSMLLLNSIISFALNDEQSAWLQANIVTTNTMNGEVSGSEAWIGKYITANESKAEKKDGDTISLGTWSIGDMSGEYYLAKGKTLDGLAKQITKSINQVSVTGRVEEMIQDLELSADTVSDRHICSPIKYILWNDNNRITNCGSNRGVLYRHSIVSKQMP